MALMDIMYNKLNEVLGSGDQLFTLEFPARALNPNLYTYDTSDRNSVLTKPYVVQEAEFRLVDGLLNTSPITQGPNGKQLSVVYDRLLNNYVPKLEDLKSFILDKYDLRKFLLEKIEDNIDGEMIKCSRMEFCQRLYSKYLDRKNQWLKAKDEKFESSREKKDFDGFAKWVSSEGLVRDEELNNLFNDVVVRGNYHEVMTILGFLNISSSSEALEKNKQNMRSCIRKSLDASMFVYPVQLQPNDWFKSLKSNFSPKDLLNSGEKFRQDLFQKQKRLRKVNEKIAEFDLINISDDEFKKLEETVKENQNKLATAENNLVENHTSGAVTLFKIYLNSCTGGGLNTIEELKKVDEKEKKKVRDKLGLAEDAAKSMEKTYSGLGDVIASAERLEDARKLRIRAKTKNYQLELLNLRSQKEELEEEIEWIGNMLGGIYNIKVNDEKAEASTNLMPTGQDLEDSEYTDIIITSEEVQADRDSSESQKSSSSSWKVSGWFASVGKSSHSSSATSSLEESLKNEKIEIGLRVTKVSIDRGGWFDPSLFDLTNAFYRLADYKAGPGVTVDTLKAKTTSSSYQELLKWKNDSEESVDYALPSYPTSFIIAKDITIKVTTNDSDLSSVKSSFEENSSSAGGILGFGSSSSNSESGESSAYHKSEIDKTLYLRIPGPQILGWFQELTPEDKSENYKSLISTNVNVDRIKEELNKYTKEKE